MATPIGAAPLRPGPHQVIRLELKGRSYTFAVNAADRAALPRLDMPRVDEFERELQALARRLGFLVYGFHLEEERLGELPPGIVIEAVQLPLVDVAPEESDA